MWVCSGGGFVLWVCLIWWMSGVGCEFGMWVCLVWWMWVCADLSGCFFFFDDDDSDRDRDMEEVIYYFNL